VVINNFNVYGIAASPHKTHEPLVIDADDVLSLALTLQSLKPVVGRYRQIIQPGGPVQHLQLALSNRAKIDKTRNRCASKQALCISAFETFNHA
jgi:hypothetical protein